MLDKNWLPDVRRELYYSEGECLVHIEEDTFNEEDFVRYFQYWDSYIDILMRYPEEKDVYDAKNLPKIAAYYNTHTKTSYYYSESTGKRGIKEYTPSSSSNNTTNDDEKEKYKKYALIGGSILLAILLLRGCAHAEVSDIKKALLSNKKRIEFLNKNFILTNVNDEVISAESYPVRKLELK